MTEERKKRLKRKLLYAREALKNEYGSFALPLWDMYFVATEDVWRVSTNGLCIYFDPNWLQKLNEEVLAFILAHELMHIELKHIRRETYYRGDRFHLACDIVANSHLAAMGWEAEKLPGIGSIYTQTFFPKIEGRELTAQEAIHGVPFDPSGCKPGERRKYMIDSEEWWERKYDRGEQGIILLHPGEDEELEAKVKPAEAPMLIPKRKPRELIYLSPEDSEGEEPPDTTPKALGDAWNTGSREALETLRDQKERQQAAGIQEEFRERIWHHGMQSTLRWRELLHRFVQTEVCDYSFLPPDRRMAESEFFLPDFNEAREIPMKLWFMVDTSASVTDQVLDGVYGELCSALSQMGGGIHGYLGFFDTRVYAPKPFSNLTELSAIVPRGGGGTNFSCIFEWLEGQSELPDSLVVFTDGQAEFPEEPAGVPVLWLFTDRNVTAPWGSAAFVSAAY